MDRRAAGRRGARPGRSTDSAHITSGPRSTATQPRTASMRGSGRVQRGAIGSVRVTSSPTLKACSTTAVPGPTVRHPSASASSAPVAHDGTRSVSAHGCPSVSVTRTVTVPSCGIARGHLDADAPAIVEGRGDAAVGVLVDLDPAAVGGGQVAGEAGERPRHVRRAAGDEEPRLAQARRRPLALDVVARNRARAPAGAAGWRRRSAGRRAPATSPRRCTACAR